MNKPTSPNHFSFPQYLRDSLVIFFLWLLLFAALRAFSLYGLDDPNQKIWLILFRGFYHDGLALALFFIPWSLAQLRFQSAFLSRYFFTVVLAGLALPGFCNALFITWAHEPINHSFLTYLVDLKSFMVSAGQLTAPTHITLGAVLILLVPIMLNWIYAFHTMAWQTRLNITLWGWCLIMLALFCGRVENNKILPGKPWNLHLQVEAAVKNIVTHEIVYTIAHWNDASVALARPANEADNMTDFIRLTLVKDIGE